MSTTSVWLRTGPPQVHKCQLPRWRERRRMGAKRGALWRCWCQKVWEWTSYDGVSYWEEVR